MQGRPGKKIVKGAELESGRVMEDDGRKKPSNGNAHGSFERPLSA
jgi:hypothetical protein